MTRRLQGRRVTRREITSCPPGKILRDAYVRLRRDSRVFVPASCITDVGNPGKGLPGGEPGIGPLRQGDLKQFGYDNVVSLTQGRRHLAIARAVHAYGALSVWRKLNAVYIYTRRTAPTASAVFKADRDWVKVYYDV